MKANNYYNKIAKIYDLMYTKKEGFNHKKQVEWVDNWRKKHKLAKSVLDLACGTGIHLKYFKQKKYQCVGIDASAEMLKIAKKTVKGITLKQGYFHNFKLNQKFPMITSFFNAMSYNNTKNKFKTALKNIYNHLEEDGLFVFDMFCTDKSSKIFITKNFERKGFKISRTIVGTPTKQGFKSTMYYIIFDGKSSEIIEETTLRGVYSAKEVKKMLIESGFKVLYDGKGYGPSYGTFVAQK